MDEFQKIEARVHEFLTGIVSELTFDLAATAHNKIVADLENPCIRLAWTGKSLSATVSYHDGADPFADEIWVRRVEIDGMWEDNVETTHPEDLANAIMSASDHRLTDQEKIDCAKFLRRIADAMEQFSKA